MMLQIKFGCNRPAGLGDIHVWKCGRTHGRTDTRTHGRTPARVPSYKLTLWAFGSGELIKWTISQRPTKSRPTSTIRINHKRSTALERSVINYWGGGWGGGGGEVLKPMLRARNPRLGFCYGSYTCKFAPHEWLLTYQWIKTANI